MSDSLLEIERGIIGACIHRQANLYMATAVGIDTETFDSPVHQIIFNTIQKLDKDDGCYDFLTVLNALKKRTEYEIEWGEIISESLDYAYFSEQQVEHYSKMLIENHNKNALLQIDIEKIVKEAETSDDAIGEIERQVVDIAKRKTFKYKSRREVEGEVWDSLAAPTSLLYTGLSNLDEIIGGVEPGSVVVIGASPSVGKTVLMEQFATAFAEQGSISGIMSIETKSERLVRRSLSMQTGINSNAFKKCDLTESQWTKIAEQIALNEQLSKMIYYDDRADVSIHNAPGRIKTMHYIVKAENIFIDYLQLIKTGRDKRTDIDNVINDIKETTKTLGLRTFVLSQLSRPNQDEDDVNMFRLKESGGIEACADIILLPQRNPSAGDVATKVWVAKNRDGKTGSTTIYFCPRRVRFYDTEAEALLNNRGIDSFV